MKRLGLIGLALAVFALPALAGPGNGRHAEHLDRIAQELGLDAAQSEQFATIMAEQHLKRREQGKALREQGVERGSDEARAHHEAMRQETHERLSGLLTAEQLEQLKTIHKEHRQRRKERKHRAHGEDTI